MLIQDPSLLNKIAEWRRKCTDGSITLDEMREAVRVMRGNRVSATAEAAKPKRGGGGSRAKSPPPDAGSLLDELKGS